MRATVNIYPNNEIRFRAAPPPRKSSKSGKADSKKYEHTLRLSAPPVVSEGYVESLLGKYAINRIDGRDVPKMLELLLREPCGDKGARCMLPSYLAAQEEGYSDLSPDDYMIGQESKGHRAGWGYPTHETEFTAKAKRTVLRIGGMVDKLFKGRVLFLTGTLPGSTEEAKEAIAYWSGYIVNRVRQWVRRRVDNMTDYGVWEWQKRGALHLHYCVASHDEKILERVDREFHDFWCQVLEDVSVKSGVDLFARGDNCRGDVKTWRYNWKKVQTRVERVKKSVSAYLSKYLCKGSDSNSEQKRYYPSQWWTRSNYLVGKLHEMTKRFSVGSIGDPQLESIWKQVEEIASKCRKSHSYRDKVGYGMNMVIYHYPGQEYIFDEIVKLLPSEQCVFNPRRRLAHIQGREKRDREAEIMWRYGEVYEVTPIVKPLIQPPKPVIVEQLSLNLFNEEVPVTPEQVEVQVDDESQSNQVFREEDVYRKALSNKQDADKIARDKWLSEMREYWDWEDWLNGETDFKKLEDEYFKYAFGSNLPRKESLSRAEYVGRRIFLLYESQGEDDKALAMASRMAQLW